MNPFSGPCCRGTSFKVTFSGSFRRTVEFQAMTLVALSSLRRILHTQPGLAFYMSRTHSAVSSRYLCVPSSEGIESNRSLRCFAIANPR